MKRHCAPIQGQVRTEDLHRNHQQGYCEVNGVDFCQPVPDKFPVVGNLQMTPENINVVVGEDETAQNEEKGDPDHAGVK